VPGLCRLAGLGRLLKIPDFLLSTGYLKNCRLGLQVVYTNTSVSVTIANSRENVEDQASMGHKLC
jgi:hypothetical protein